MKRKAKPKPKRSPGRGVSCPSCGRPTATLYTRPKGAVTFRRRVCECGVRFTTREEIVNRKRPESSTDKTAAGLAITDLLRTLGMTPRDLAADVTLNPSESGHEGRDADRAR